MLRNEKTKSAKSVGEDSSKASFLFHRFHRSCVDVCAGSCEATVRVVLHCTLSPGFARTVVGETGCCSGCFRVMSLGEYCKTQTACLTGTAKRENLDLS